MLKQEGFVREVDVDDGQKATVIDCEGNLHICIFWGTYPHGSWREVTTCDLIEPMAVRIENGNS